MKYPEFLSENGKIGFLAPSFGCATEPYKSAFENAMKKLGEKGHTFLLGPNTYSDCGVGISNTPEKCAQEVNDMFESEADVLISCGGGELMCEILPHIDFERLKNTSKWFMGYSDNTNLTFLLNTICDTASIYGICASTFGQDIWHSSVADAYDTIRGKKLSNTGYDMWEKDSLKSEDNPLASYNVTEKREIKAFCGTEKLDKVQLSGRLIGGCLDCLAGLVGTRYDHVKEFTEKYKDDKILWFLESCDLHPFDVRRAMWHLREAGWFDNAAGFLIGRPLHFGENAFGLDMYSAVLEPLKNLQIPVIMDLDIGHLPPQMPMISGSMGRLLLDGQNIRIDFELK